MNDDYSRYDEYKMLIEDTARFTDRRQNASTLYTSINSIFLAALAIIISDFDQQSDYALWAALVMIIAGIITSIYWRIYIVNYKKLSNIRFTVLKQMEQEPGMEKSIKIYEKERDLYPKDDSAGLFAIIEKRLPETFIAIYIFAVIVMVAVPLLQQ